MKPVIIYTLPRTRGKAALSACKRETLLNEPLGYYIIFPELLSISYPMPTSTLFDIRNRMLNFTGWDTLRNTLDNPNSASKIFGSNLYEFPKARAWFRNTIHTHERFVLLRSPREIIWSFALATFFGFRKEKETEDREIEISDHLLFQVDRIFQQFLTFYPEDAKIITFESLPEEHFDYSKINIINQNSLTRRLPYVKNIDEVNRTIDTILNFHRIEWEEKTGTDIFA